MSLLYLRSGRTLNIGFDRRDEAIRYLIEDLPPIQAEIERLTRQLLESIGVSVRCVRRGPEAGRNAARSPPACRRGAGRGARGGIGSVCYGFSAPSPKPTLRKCRRTPAVTERKR